MSTQPNAQQGTPDAPQDEGRDRVLQGHTYDGIKEYDNPMPGWWVWLFWATAAFAVFYFVGITFFDVIDTYEDDLAESRQELQMIREAYAEANPTFEASAEVLAAAVADPQQVEAGAALFAASCAACHGNAGQGLIGPNLTDAYWIHGGTPLDVYNIITKGVAEKGMPPWESALSAEERVALVAFIESLAGTEPPNAKEPQGELVSETDA